MRNSEKKPKRKVLVAAADMPYASTVARSLESYGYVTDLCHDGKGVLRLVSHNTFDVIVLELDLSDETGVDLVSYIRRRLPPAQLILLFDMSRIERALDGVRRGAFFYLPKTSQPSDVALVVNKAIRSLDAETTMRQYDRDLLEELMSGASGMKRVVEQIAKVAPTNSTVLLLGESGTGKELIANTIHRLSHRREMPFIAINCAALPEALLESEMFGHVKGAFTGAHADKRGLFEEADGGTIFLDEIGEMALITQAKLLRVLQNGEIRPVGSSVTRHVDVRVIAATNRDLERAVAENAFREDLYFRLNVIQMRVPPLRERMETLPKLVRYFVNKYNREHGKNVADIDEQAQALLRNYSYPGNVRELESIIAHAVIMCEGHVVRARDLPEQVRRGDRPRLALPNYSADSIPTVNEMEAQLIRTALQRLNGNQTEVAQKLGMSRSTLWRKMKQYDIRN